MSRVSFGTVTGTDFETVDDGDDFGTGTGWRSSSDISSDFVSKIHLDLDVGLYSGV